MDYECQARLFRILSNPLRIQILELLTIGPLCVSEMVRCTNQRQAYISQQLMLLRSKGIVTANKEGWTVCYQFMDNPESVWLKHLLIEIRPKLEKIMAEPSLKHPGLPVNDFD